MISRSAVSKCMYPIIDSSGFVARIVFICNARFKFHDTFIIQIVDTMSGLKKIYMSDPVCNVTQFAAVVTRRSFFLSNLLKLFFCHTVN